MKSIATLIWGITLSSCVPTVIHFPEREKLAEVLENVPASQDQLFLKANGWMTETIGDAEKVVQHFEDEEGVIIGNYIMNGSIASDKIDNRVHAIIEIRVRDNNARIEIRPQARWRYSNNPQSPYTYSKEDARFQMNKLLKSFYETVVGDPGLVGSNAPSAKNPRPGRLE